MSATVFDSDDALLNLLRKRGSVEITELVDALGVTATAVRQRLTRLMDDGLITREESERRGRGRPRHSYQLTEKGRRTSGNNYADLVDVLWAEIRAIEDPEIQAGLLKRIATQLASRAGELSGATLGEKMQNLAQMMQQRRIPFEVEMKSDELPVLTAMACPYPELVEQDKSICAMERMLFSEVLGESLKLSGCRPQGDSCCSFEPSRAGDDSLSDPLPEEN
ncbi:helix-turn-helix transcriptional regulator [Aeoliella mucimassa]|uniref:Transcriptional regulator PadR-like family protein n=1 Tax=Aeoliella mucimassa TaxID=2527972 RepID=A0A518AP43_9BACT|nr:helix-turn-helix transcriptional regulator [Aeoliella mucimassa]QDU56493.1 Transcriptional regulator PadR-like family protein [Aeoliella mucimassa]